MTGIDEDEAEELDIKVKVNKDDDKHQVTPKNEDIFAEETIDFIEQTKIQQTIRSVLMNCPNQSCTIDSIATRVLKELGIITRGKPRIEFEKKVSKALGTLVRQGKVEKYKAKNERIRLQ